MLQKTSQGEASYPQFWSHGKAVHSTPLTYIYIYSGLHLNLDFWISDRLDLDLGLGLD